MSDKKIKLGMQWAYKLSQASHGNELEKVRAEMTAEDQAALGAFRDHQLATIVGEIEDSQEGAQIRHDVAKQIYSELVAKGIAASLKDGKS